MDSDSYRRKNEIITPLLLEWEAEEILTPVSMIQFINIDDEYNHIQHIISTTNYSNYPVYKDGVDNILGVLHVADLVKLDRNNNVDLNSVLRYPLFISENKNLLEILREFHQKNSSFAIVVDEHGSVRGIVTKQNIIDFLWDSNENKNSTDEYVVDKNAPLFIDPRTPIDEFNKKFSVNLEGYDCETIGGYMIEKLTYVPQLGESLEIENMLITVSKTEGAKLLELTIKFN